MAELLESNYASGPRLETVVHCESLCIGLRPLETKMDNDNRGYWRRVIQLRCIQDEFNAKYPPLRSVHDFLVLAWLKSL